MQLLAQQQAMQAMSNEQRALMQYQQQSMQPPYLMNWGAAANQGHEMLMTGERPTAGGGKRKTKRRKQSVGSSGSSGEVSGGVV